MVDLTPATALICAIKAYESPLYIKSEFKDDFKHFNYVKRLFRRYHKDKVLKERLILNHLVIIYNTFQGDEATRLLFYYVRPADYSVLKTFLLFLYRMPEKIESIRGSDIHSYDITIDPIAVRFLKGLR